jgi:hypothetical protein
MTSQQNLYLCLTDESVLCICTGGNMHIATKRLSVRSEDFTAMINQIVVISGFDVV